MTAPATSQTRLPALDIVRGIAVLGIVIPNIVGLGQPMNAYAWPDGFLSGPGAMPEALWAAQLTLVDGKFRTLFTLLFGAGMVLFHRSAQAKGAEHNLLVRRLGWLAVFGALHWLLLWRGDILLPYAIGGLIASPLIAMDPTRRLALGLAGYLVGAGLALATALLLTLDTAAIAEIVQDERAHGTWEERIMLGGSYAQWVGHGLASHWGELTITLPWAMLETLPLILIGMSLVDKGLFDGRSDARRQQRWGVRLWLAGTAITLAIALASLPGGIGYADSLVASSWAALPTLAAGLGLIALLALWGQRANGAVARALGAAGRCAFTNYIGTSTLALIVFSGWGLGLFGRLGRPELYGLVVVFWAIMLAWPQWWLARFRHGPLEWLWRCLTYGKRLPMRR